MAAATTADGRTHDTRANALTMTQERRIIVLGCTGSIGTATAPTLTSTFASTLAAAAIPTTLASTTVTAARHTRWDAGARRGGKIHHRIGFLRLHRRRRI